MKADLDAIAAREETLPEGEWWVSRAYGVVPCVSGGGGILLLPPPNIGVDALAVCRFAAAARQDVPALAAEVESLREGQDGAAYRAGLAKGRREERDRLKALVARVGLDFGKEAREALSRILGAMEAS